MKNLRKQNGAITVFATLALIPMLIFCAVITDGARVMLEKAATRSAEDLTLNTVLSLYDRNLEQNYCLLGTDQSISNNGTDAQKTGLISQKAHKDAVENLLLNLGDSETNTKFLSPTLNEGETRLSGVIGADLANPVALQKQIEDCSSLKGVADFTTTAISEFIGSEKIEKIQDFQNTFGKYSNYAAAMTDLLNLITGLPETIAEIKSSIETIKTGFNDLGPCVDKTPSWEDRIATDITNSRTSPSTRNQEVVSELKQCNKSISELIDKLIKLEQKLAFLLRAAGEIANYVHDHNKEISDYVAAEKAAAGETNDTGRMEEAERAEALWKGSGNWEGKAKSLHELLYQVIQSFRDILQYNKKHPYSTLTYDEILEYMQSECVKNSNVIPECHAELIDYRMLIEKFTAYAFPEVIIFLQNETTKGLEELAKSGGQKSVGSVKKDDPNFWEAVHRAIRNFSNVVKSFSEESPSLLKDENFKKDMPSTLLNYDFSHAESSGFDTDYEDSQLDDNDALLNMSNQTSSNAKNWIDGFSKLKNPEQWLDNLLLSEYLVNNFNNITLRNDPRNSANWSGVPISNFVGKKLPIDTNNASEQEYVVFGNTNAYEAFMTIYAIRFICNFISILSTASEIKAWLHSISAVAGPFAPALEIVLMILVALGESALDMVEMSVYNWPVPFLKNDTTFLASPTGLPTFAQIAEKKGNYEKFKSENPQYNSAPHFPELRYAQYVQMFFIISAISQENKKKMVARMGDVIQSNIASNFAKDPTDNGFRLHNSYTNIELRTVYTMKPFFLNLMPVAHEFKGPFSQISFHNRTIAGY